MYLHSIKAAGFRSFGDGTNVPALDLTLNRGLNILIGENDAGKSTIVDAIRLLLWTTSYEVVRIQDTDFHAHGVSRFESFTIEATLKGLSTDQEAAALEWLTYESDGTRSLVLHLQANRYPASAGKRARVGSVTKCGYNGTGPEIGSVVRDMIRATYLRPLRDAEAELRPGRQSRLSQILGAHPSMQNQDKSDFIAGGVMPETLVGMMDSAQHLLQGHKAITSVQTDINDHYLAPMSFKGDQLQSRIQISAATGLTQILERFELTLLAPGSIDPGSRCPRGLGYNNALFMATELVLLSGGDEALPLLLVEEPEAHMHPQLQNRVLDLVKSKASGDAPSVQIIVTTHSPTLACSAPLKSLILVRKSTTHPLRPEETRLDALDYSYLERFLEATRANLFFARGVLIVEGPGEHTLFPALAEACGISLSEHGISVVNVGDVGLYHYARIFQRTGDAKAIGVPVACITDRDIVPDIAGYVNKPKNNRKRFESDYTEAQAEAAVQRKIDRVEVQGEEAIKVFVSDFWTLEYDLAYEGQSKLMHAAIALAVAQKSKGKSLTQVEEEAAIAASEVDWAAAQAKHGADKAALAAEIYEPLYVKDCSKAVTAQYAAKLLATKKYGAGDALLDSLPKYIASSLRHVTGAGDATAKGSHSS